MAASVLRSLHGPRDARLRRVLARRPDARRGRAAGGARGERDSRPHGHRACCRWPPTPPASSSRTWWRGSSSSPSRATAGSPGPARLGPLDHPCHQLDGVLVRQGLVAGQGDCQVESARAWPIAAWTRALRLPRSPRPRIRIPAISSKNASRACVCRRGSRPRARRGSPATSCPRSRPTSRRRPRVPHGAGRRDQRSPSSASGPVAGASHVVARARLEQARLVGKVAIDRGALHPRLLGDRTDGCSGGPERPVQLHGRLRDRLPRLLSCSARRRLR